MKPLSQGAKAILTEIILEGERPIPYDRLEELGELTRLGLAKGASLGVVATTKGVKKALSLKLVTQDGTDFLGKDGKRKARPTSLKVVGLVKPHKPITSNAWDMGFEDAKAGMEPAGPFMADAEYMAGYGAWSQAQRDLGKSSE